MFYLLSTVLASNESLSTNSSIKSLTLSISFSLWKKSSDGVTCNKKKFSNKKLDCDSLCWYLVRMNLMALTNNTLNMKFKICCNLLWLELRKFVVYFKVWLLMERPNGLFHICRTGWFFFAVYDWNVFVVVCCRLQRMLITLIINWRWN